MTKLFSPFKIRGLEIKNRLLVFPMCMYSGEDKDGVVGQWHLVHLGSRAMGGAGMVIAETSAVNPEDASV
jgi:2,4-dienoyl-CoA reductase-like NADH-dependent reductase (Old Yellow Enzyme family)